MYWTLPVFGLLQRLNPKVYVCFHVSNTKFDNFSKRGPITTWMTPNYWFSLKNYWRLLNILGNNLEAFTALASLTKRKGAYLSMTFGLESYERLLSLCELSCFGCSFRHFCIESMSRFPIDYANTLLVLECILWAVVIETGACVGFRLRFCLQINSECFMGQ